MKKIKIGIITYLVFILALGPTLAVDTASLLPNAVQQFFDNNGNPLTSGKVTTYAAGTSTLKTTWKDSAEVTPNTNPIILDAGGKAIIYGSGNYRQVVKDRNGNLIWDAVTAPGGGGSSPTNIGDGNLVGTVLPWSGLIAPNQYVFAYGQEINRTTFSDFFTAVTQQLNVICSASSNILTGISDTSQIRIGSPIELALCVVAGTTVTAKTASTITLSNPSNVSINAVATFFPWGNGNGSTTFNVPDFRGVVMAGRTNMGGTASTNLTSVGCPTISPDSLGANCGSQTLTIAQTNLPNVNFTVTGNYTFPATTPISVTLGGTTVNTVTGSTTLPLSTATAASGGSGTAISKIQPTITVNYIVKVSSDTSGSIATGVFSIGGMTGIISCGTGILCTGNILSAIGTVPGGGINNVQYKNSLSAFEGSNNFTFISPDNLVLGAAGVSSKFDIFGLTSGRVRQTVAAIAGTTNITWGNVSGTPAVTASSPIILNNTTGNLTCPTCATSSGGGAITGVSPINVSAAGAVSITGAALTKTDDTNVTLTLGGGPTTSVISATSLTLGWSGTLAPTRGGTGLGSYVQGDILYASAANTLSALAKDTNATRYLSNTGTSNNPAWAQVVLTTGVSDYSEGSWTPVLAGSSVAGTQTYSVQLGRYIKIGNMVTVWASIVLTAKGGTTSGNMSVTGLPFTISNISNYFPQGTMGYALWDFNVAGNYYNMGGFGQANTTRVDLFEIGDNVSPANLTEADFSNTSTLFFSMSYRIN